MHGLLFVTMHRLIIMVASLVEHGLSEDLWASVVAVPRLLIMVASLVVERGL